MRKIFPNNYMVIIFTIMIMYGIFIYFIWISGENYFAIPLILAMGILMINRRIYLGRDFIRIIEGYSRTTIDYSEITEIRFGEYRPKMTNARVNAIEFILKDSQIVRLKYKSYSEKDIDEILVEIQERNDEVEIIGVY